MMRTLILHFPAIYNPPQKVDDPGLSWAHSVDSTLTKPNQTELTSVQNSQDASLDAGALRDRNTGKHWKAIWKSRSGANAVDSICRAGY